MEKGAKYRQLIFTRWCKSCGICVSCCPHQVLEMDDGGHPVPVRPEKCKGCRFCELHCPDFAIEVRDEEVSTR